MRVFLTLSAAALAGLGLSGCAVIEVGSAVVGVGATVVSTTASVAGDVISAPFPDSSDDKKKD